MTTYNVGDEILVTVGSRTFTTVIDPYNTQRFKMNTVIDAFVEASYELSKAWNRSDHSTPQPYTLNTLVSEYAEGKHTQDDMLTFYTSIGYSVSGFADLNHFGDLDIRNPVWEEDDYKTLSFCAWAELMSLIGEESKHSGNNSVRYLFDAVAQGKWKVDNLTSSYAADSDTIDRVVKAFLRERDIEPWDITITANISKELKGFLRHLS